MGVVQELPRLLVPTFCLLVFKLGEGASLPSKSIRDLTLLLLLLPPPNSTETGPLLGGLLLSLLKLKPFPPPLDEKLGLLLPLLGLLLPLLLGLLLLLLPPPKLICDEQDCESTKNDRMV